MTSPEFIFDYPAVEYLRVKSNTAVLGHILSSFFLVLLCNNKKDIKKTNNMQKVLGPVVLAGQDLETLKVPWSWQDRT